jgi:16S rRNA U1498 N3-methylase RsmE
LPAVDKGRSFLSEGDDPPSFDVMRSKVGEAIEIVDEGDVYDPLRNRHHNQSSKERFGDASCQSEASGPSSFGLPLLKHGNDDLVLEKGTELGVSSFLSFYLFPHDHPPGFRGRGEKNGSALKKRS